MAKLALSVLTVDRCATATSDNWEIALLDPETGTGLSAYVVAAQVYRLGAKTAGVYAVGSSGAAQVWRPSAGAVAAEVFSVGAEASDIFSPGATAGEVSE
jgi:hypothetical protein